MPSLIFHYVIYHVYGVICHTPSFPPGIPPPSMLVFVSVFWKHRCAGPSPHPAHLSLVLDKTEMARFHLKSSDIPRKTLVQHISASSPTDARCAGCNISSGYGKISNEILPSLACPQLGQDVPGGQWPTEPVVAHCAGFI